MTWTDDDRERIRNLFAEINDMMEYDEDPVGVTDWWRTPSRFYGNCAPLDALINDDLTIEAVEEEMDYFSRGM